MVETYDYLYKIILLGDSSVGKTSILLRFSENKYSTDFHSTIGVDFRVSLQKYNDKNVKLQLWDTAGQERFRNIVSSYYRVAHAAFFIFDITNLSSFENISMWIGESENFLKDDIPKFLIGNKADLEDSRMVVSEKALRFAERLKMSYFEVSAKTSLNVSKVFQEIVKVLVEKGDNVSKTPAKRISIKKEEACCGV